MNALILLFLFVGVFCLIMIGFLFLKFSKSIDNELTFKYFNIIDANDLEVITK